MPIVRGTFAEALAPGLNVRTFGVYQQYPEIYSSIVNVGTSNKAYEEDFAFGGFGPLVEAGELEATTLDEPIKIGGVRFIHKKLKLGYVISEEMRDDDQIGFAMMLAGELGESSRWTTELYGHDVYNNGFSGAKYVGRDGLALFHTAHPIQGTGGTIGNKPAVDVALSQAALEAAWSSFQLQVNERGMPVQIQPVTLLVPPGSVLAARRFMETTAYPGGNLNDINPLRGWVNIVSSPYLTDTDAWFLLGPTNKLGVRFYWRKRPDTRTWDDPDTEGTIHKIVQRHSVGFDDWRGTYASSGT